MEKTEFNNLDELVDDILKNMSEESKVILTKCATAKSYDIFKLTFEFPAKPRVDHQQGEKIFGSIAHHGFGTGMRNDLNLWWTPEFAKRYTTWPQEKPKLIAWFESIGLDGTFGVVGDDRSGLLIRAIYRKYHQLDVDVQGYVNRLKKFYSDQRKLRKKIK